MNISFSRLGNHGRLGNQLFQVAAVLGLAEKYGATASFPKWDYELYFETNLPHGVLEKKRVEEKYFHFYDWSLTDSCDLFGYLQSEKYFGSTHLKLKADFVAAQKVKYDIFDRETICIQIRRGDYVGNPNYYQLPATFYMDALLTYFPKWRDCNLLFTSDDIEYARTHFECLPNATFSKGLTEIEDLALASCCDHFIISNSTFGWWCAYLGEKEGTKVVHSGHLTTGALASQDSRDYRPERWIEYKKDGYRLPLQDMTFTIPVFYDHLDRKDNLDLTLCLLMRELDTSFIICEQGGDKFSYMQQWARYLTFPGKEFHRTKMLNWMAEVSETPYVANWDADVIIPPAQVFMAVEKLRAGADMVFPYDGRFARLPRDPWFKNIQKSLDIGIVGATKFKGRVHGHNSVGGAVMYNKEAFVDAGMENEYMISFAPEDAERNDRWKRLGFDVQMTPGSLFHINHHVGINSSSANPYFKAGHAELEKIRAMSDPELRAYVDTWPWRHQYTSRYYQRISEGSIRSAKIVMEALYFKPVTAIDVGCGLGEWNNGNREYFGIDHRIRRKDLMILESQYMDCDLDKEFPSIQGPFGLCICLEVAEHLLPPRAELLVAFLCSLSDRVLFSAAIPHQGGVGHKNEQWQSYWAELFRKNGFGASEFQPDIRANREVEPWYRNNLILYEKDADGLVHDLILPDYYMQIVGHLKSRLTDLRK
jgi:hypothetical protein